jgi:hypothetical protein
MQIDLSWVNSGVMLTIGAAISWAVSQLFIARGQKDQRVEHADNKQIELIKHGNDLMLEMLQAARQALADLKQDNSSLTSKLAASQLRFSELLDHAIAILSACSDDQREQAEEKARLYINKIHRHEVK